MTTAADIFSLHKKVTTYEISDGEQTVTIGIRALNSFENDRLSERMLKLRPVMEQALDAAGFTESVSATMRDLIQMGPLGMSRFMDMLIAYESAAANTFTDLAPDDDERPPEGEDPEVTAEKKAARVMAKWKAHRQEELEAQLQTEDGLALHIANLVRLQKSIRLQTDIQEALGKEQLAMMVVDPETGAPIFSADPHAKHFIGGLSMETLEDIKAARDKFVASLTEQALRVTAESGRFLPSGESRRRRRGSRGATTVTSPSSLPPASDSSASASG